jgi:hypothetical protein
MTSSFLVCFKNWRNKIFKNLNPQENTTDSYAAAEVKKLLGSSCGHHIYSVSSTSPHNNDRLFSADDELVRDLLTANPTSNPLFQGM